MSAFQVCARCATRWPVGARPAVWCPRCHGVLLSPVSSQAPAMGGRNFKWVARRPRTRAPHRATRSAPRRTETPRYDEIPRWGLIDRPPAGQVEREPRLQRWAGAAAGLLVLLGSLLLLAAAAEAFRYGILLYNRTRLVSQTTLVVSDALVLFAEVASIVIGIAAAVASTCWLIDRRRAMFDRAGTRDPRSSRTVFVGSLVPVLSLVMPGVFLTELVDGRARADRGRLLLTVRVWWVLWVVDWALVATATGWRFRDSLQAQADGVLLSAVVALFGAGVVLLTIHLMRSIDGLRWRGTPRATPTRWVVSSARQVPPSTVTNPEGANSEDTDPEEHVTKAEEKAAVS